MSAFCDLWFPPKILSIIFFFNMLPIDHLSFRVWPEKIIDVITFFLCGFCCELSLFIYEWFEANQWTRLINNKKKEVECLFYLIFFYYTVIKVIVLLFYVFIERKYFLRFYWFSHCFFHASLFNCLIVCYWWKWQKINFCFSIVPKQKYYCQ